MKLLLVVTILSILSCLPQEKGKSAVAEQQRLQPAPCIYAFQKHMLLPEIADTAQKMKTACRLSEEDVMNRASAVYR